MSRAHVITRVIRDHGIERFSNDISMLSGSRHSEVDPKPQRLARTRFLAFRVNCMYLLPVSISSSFNEFSVHIL